MGCCSSKTTWPACQRGIALNLLDEVVGGLARTRWEARQDPRLIRIRYKGFLEF
jgi:hypothetical protein